MKRYLKSLEKILSLSFSLAKVNFKLRNEGAYLGIVWYMLEPMLMFLILLYIFSSKLGKIHNYPLYLLTGLIMYNLFSNATTQSTRAITENAKAIKSLKIPYEPLVISVVFQFIFNHILEIAVLAIFMVYYGVGLMGLLFYPVLLLLYSIFICGISFGLAALSVRISDVGNLWRVITRLLWVATPIFYSIKDKSLQFMLNPIAQFISAGRSILIECKPVPLNIVASIVFFSFSSLIVGLWIFNSRKSRFPELI